MFGNSTLSEILSGILEDVCQQGYDNREQGSSSPCPPLDSSTIAIPIDLTQLNRLSDNYSPTTNNQLTISCRPHPQNPCFQSALHPQPTADLSCCPVLWFHLVPNMFIELIHSSAYTHTHTDADGDKRHPSVHKRTTQWE